MNAFRYKLKQHIAPLHDRLESLDRMRAYSGPDGDESGYLDVLRCLYRFWLINVPATSRLPSSFHQFYESYLSALALDLDLNPAGAGHGSIRECRHEIAFFYVLLGSSLGARVLLQRRSTSQLPQQNLKVLATYGADLWKEFLSDHMVDIEATQEPEILQATEQMFHDLYRNIADF